MECARKLGSAGICVEDPRSQKRDLGTHHLIQEVLTQTRKGWDRWTMILSTVGAALYPNLISLFQVAAQVRSIKATQKTRPSLRD